MNSLDFTRLRKKFELQNPESNVNVILFSIEDGNVVVHSENSQEDHLAFLRCNNPIGSVGEFFSNKSNLYVSIGKYKKQEIQSNNSVVIRTNTMRAMKSLYSNLKRFNKAGITFEECQYTEDAIFGLIMASYKYDFLKKSTEEDCCFFLNTPKYTKIVEIAHHQNIARFLGDTPANLMTPRLFVEYARKIFEGSSDVEIREYKQNFMEEKGMNLLLSVNQGSAEEPRLLQVRYSGKGKDSTDISMVGKGVCFDTGGISIKPSANMYRMKGDMMGAATLLCSLKLAVTLGLNMNIVLTIPLVENMPSGTATKPGDVFKSMSGVTVEVDNTDAEGRLILADALTFAQEDHPSYLIDAATLTGAITISLGSVFSGFFTEDDELASEIQRCGIESNDQFWRMPLSSFFRDAMKSQVADINNMGGRGAGSCKAAEFLKEFVDTKATKWVHFDIAGMIDDTYLPEIYGEGMTGRPVRGFINLIEKLVSKGGN